ncbi:MAG TPA: formylglycine-generating enzyme family protein [Longimicrobiales bacterium]
MRGRRVAALGLGALVGAAAAGLALRAWPTRAGDAGAAGDPGAARRGPPPGVVVPEGMVYVPGGIARIGSEDGPPEERPVFETWVEPFFLDVHPVTVAQFRAFVEATGYVTDAERLGDAGVYDVRTGEWRLVRGATWRRPLGPDGPEAPDDHPVTQVSWNDAVAYARWVGKRLPTEIEWEHAARGARNAPGPYPWGSSLREGGRHHANTWQGAFPDGNTLEDGYLYTSPVGAFGTTELGLADMGGNVWEWTADWFRPYAERGRPFRETAAGEKVQRGGSFLCSPTFCRGYRVSARSHSTPETALFHVGFRLAKDAPG